MLRFWGSSMPQRGDYAREICYFVVVHASPFSPCNLYVLFTSHFQLIYSGLSWRHRSFLLPRSQCCVQRMYIYVLCMYVCKVYSLLRAYTTTIPHRDIYHTLLGMVCVCVCVFSSPSFWTSSSLDILAGVTQAQGHTGFFIHLPSAVRALFFFARRIQPFLSLVDREIEFCVLTI